MEIIEYACKRNLNINITTNGTYLDKYTQEKLIEYGITGLFVSIDGGTREINDSIRGKGTFDLAMNNISSFCKKITESKINMAVGLSTVITSINVDSIKDLILACKQNNIPQIAISTLINEGNATMNWNNFNIESNVLYTKIIDLVQFAQNVYPELYIQVGERPLFVWYLNKKYNPHCFYITGYTGCPLLEGSIYIESDGQIHPCGLYSMEIGKKYEKLGYFDHKKSVKALELSKLSDAFDTEYYKAFMNGMKELKKDRYSQACFHCHLKKDCYPCPYQFTQGSLICDWTYAELKNWINQLKQMVIVKNTDWKKYLMYLNDFEVDILKIIINNKSLNDNYLNIQKKYEDLKLLRFIDLLYNFEKKFLIKLK